MTTAERIVLGIVAVIVTATVSGLIALIYYGLAVLSRGGG